MFVVLSWSTLVGRERHVDATGSRPTPLLLPLWPGQHRAVLGQLRAPCRRRMGMAAPRCRPPRCPTTAGRPVAFTLTLAPDPTLAAAAAAVTADLAVDLAPPLPPPSPPPPLAPPPLLPSPPPTPDPVVLPSPPLHPAADRRRGRPRSTTAALSAPPCALCPHSAADFCLAAPVVLCQGAQERCFEPLPRLSYYMRCCLVCNCIYVT